jgi:hypothetical protein
MTSDYRVLVSWVEQRSLAELYPFNLRDTLPCFRLPLRAGDGSPVIDLNVLMQMLYEVAALGLAIDYERQPTPGLSQDDFDWVQKMMSVQERPHLSLRHGRGRAIIFLEAAGI